MAAATGITIVKRFSYRGDANEEFSNTYWFTGAPPGTDANWDALRTALVAEEKKVYHPGVRVTRVYGYEDDTGHKPGDTGAVAPAEYIYDYVVAGVTEPVGTVTSTGGIILAGDNAVWCRWTTSRTTSPGGKKIYLRKYFHGACGNSAVSMDSIQPAQKTALLAFAAKLYDGTLSGTRKITTCGQTDTITGHDASTYVTVRTLKRRGKRSA